jgi:hypothetical protein
MAKATNKKVRHKFKLYFYTKTKVQSEKAEKAAEKAAKAAAKAAEKASVSGKRLRRITV